MKNTTEEYNRILDIVNRYAIHNAGVSFTCKKVLDVEIFIFDGMSCFGH